MIPGGSNYYTRQRVFLFTSKLLMWLSDPFPVFTKLMLASVIVMALLSALVATEPDYTGRDDS